jgi:glycosyltransferase involved in cell wall biosynthesis
MSRPWLVLAESNRRRWGGDLRRHYLLRGLAERTGATVLENWRPPSIQRSLAAFRSQPWQVWRRAPFVASAEILDDEQLAAISSAGSPHLIDIHDDPLLQAEALGIELPPERVASLRTQSDRNRAAFRWLVAPSAAFAELAGLDLDRVIVAPNGTASAIVRPPAWPDRRAVAFISGAAPSRGIEELIEAVRIVRTDDPDVLLNLWLAATGDESRAYLAGLTDAVADESWIFIGQAPYDVLGASLGAATILAIPTPANPYWDSVPPIKLFDCMAVGRPIVATPRRATAAIVRDGDCGVVTEDDSPAALAAAIRILLDDPAAARRMGGNARAIAERDYDWAAIGQRLATDVLDRLPWLDRL